MFAAFWHWWFFVTVSLPLPACQSEQTVHWESSPTPALCTGTPDWWNPRCLRIRCCRDTKTKRDTIQHSWFGTFSFVSPSLKSPIPSAQQPSSLLTVLFAWRDWRQTCATYERAHAAARHFIHPPVMIFNRDTMGGLTYSTHYQILNQPVGIVREATRTWGLTIFPPVNTISCLLEHVPRGTTTGTQSPASPMAG